MTRTPYDQACKAVLEQALRDAGRIDVQREVPGEPQWVDLFFERDPARPTPGGLLGRMAERSALFEPFHQPPDADELRACLRKALALGRGAEPPVLWILSAGRPTNVLAASGAMPLDGWPTGVYETPPLFGVRIVVVSELPIDRETLLLRLMGAGRTLTAALRELRALPPDAWEHDAAAAALRVLKSRIVALEPIDPEVAMEVEETYELWKARVRAEGEARGRAEGEARGRAEGEAEVLLRQLARRFGPVPPEVAARLRALSREELDGVADRVLDAASIAEALG